MNNSTERKRGALLSYVSIFLNSLVQLLYTPLLVRSLGQSEYGLYSIVSSLISYLTVLDLGLGNALIVYTNKYTATQNHTKVQKLHGMLQIIYRLISLFTLLLGLLLFINVDHIFGATMSIAELAQMRIMILILTFNLAATFFFNLYTALITAQEKFVFQKLLAIASTIATPLVMLPLLLFGFKSITLCIVITVVNVLSLLISFYYCRYRLKIRVHYSSFDQTILRTIFGYSIWILLGNIVDKINWSTDHFVLGAVSGTVAVSIYAVASQLNQLFINLSTAISNVFLPKMSRMAEVNSSPRAFTAEFIKVGRLQQYVIFFMCSAFVIFGQTFIQYWAGADYATSYYVTLILVIPLCFPLIQNLGISILQAKNKFRFKAITTFIMALVNIFISIILAQHFGAIGAACGTAFALIICNILIINIYYHKVIKLDIPQFWCSILKMTLPLLCLAIAFYALHRVLPFSALVNMLLLAPLYALCYLVISYCFAMNHYEQQLVRKLLRFTMLHEYLQDYHFFRRHFAYSHHSTQAKLEYAMLLEIHKLEKGFAVLNPRPFGAAKVAHLTQLIRQYESHNYPASFAYHLACSAIQAYVCFFESHHWTTTQSYLAAKQFTQQSRQFKRLPVGAFDLQKPDFIADAQINYYQFLRSRKSVRNFAERPLAAKDIQYAVKTAILSPSACNRQMCKIYYAHTKRSQKLVQQYAQGLGLFDLTHANYFVVTFDTSAQSFIGEKNQGWLNAGLFAMNFVNALHSKGIGTCFVQFGNDYHEETLLKNALQIPANERIAVLITAGYYATTSRIPYSTRKPIEEIYHEL